MSLPDLEALVARYTKWLEVHGYSPATQKTRAAQLARFVAWCSARGLTTPNELTRPILERYQRSIYEHRKKNGRRLTKIAQAHLMTAVVVFFRWLKKERLLLINPAAEVELPRYDRRPPREVLPPKEIEAFLNGIAVTTALGLRDRAIFETIYSTGIRRAELVALELEDLDLERGTLRVKEGKGGKARVVPIGARALRFIDRYLAEIRLDHAQGTAARLFLTRHGTPLTKSAVSNMVARCLRQAGIGHGGCHLFRHSAATAMLENGADVRYIQQFLGHAWLSSTEIYTHVSIRKLKEVHTRTHPAKLKRSKSRAAQREEAGQKK